MNAAHPLPPAAVSSSTGEETVPEWLSRCGLVAGVLLFILIWSWPTPAGMQPAGQRLAAVATLMGIFWVTQALPIEVTSLLPLAMFPLLGIMSAKAVGQAFFSDSSFLYLGGFLLALGIERWGLHRRLALLVVWVTGTQPRQIVLGFMLATFGISMWISNTAATLLMLPIGLALLSTLEPASGEPTTRRHPGHQHLGMALTLGIGYAATWGGMATLVGTPTNIVLVEVLQRQFPEAPRLSAGQWMATWTPFSLAMLLFTWGLLTFRQPKLPPMASQLSRGVIREQLRLLGPLRSGELWMLVLFGLTAMLWIFRTPFRLGETPLLPGWNQWAADWLTTLRVQGPKLDWVNDSTVAMTMAILLFLIPVRTARHEPWQRLMDWQTAARLPWGILLLFGGGFAIADAAQATGLAEWLGQWLATTAGRAPIWLLIVLLCALVTVLSEFTSNVATANALLPMIAGLAVALGMDPRVLMIPATVAASCGFMLPIGTPPNAIVFGSGRIRLQQMAGFGLVLDVVSVLVLAAATYLLLIPQLGIDLATLPSWARP
jgi:solute carrier family 13 (sodium-dependent dicarboxylate transporter), member 2/3/5